jgi:hypothetical protein
MDEASLGSQTIDLAESFLPTLSNAFSRKIARLKTSQIVKEFNWPVGSSIPACTGTSHE